MPLTDNDKQAAQYRELVAEIQRRFHERTTEHWATIRALDRTHSHGKVEELHSLIQWMAENLKPATVVLEEPHPLCEHCQRTAAGQQSCCPFHF